MRINANKLTQVLIFDITLLKGVILRGTVQVPRYISQGVHKYGNINFYVCLNFYMHVFEFILWW